MTQSLIGQFGHLVLQSPDPEVLVRELTEITGLQLRGEDRDTFYLSCNHGRRSELCLKSGSPAMVLSVGLEAFDEDAFAEIYRRVRAEGLTIIAKEPTALGVEKGFQLVTPFGPVFEVHTKIPALAETGDQGAENGTLAPDRLEHANLKVEDPRGCKELLERLFALRLSDRTAGGEVFWLRGGNCLHHILVLFTQGEAPASQLSTPGRAYLHHYAFSYTDLAGLAAVADRLSERDRTLVWGIGHHAIGGSYFIYYRDSDGYLVECSAAMQKIPEDGWQPRDFTKSDVDRLINIWGAAPPVNFLDFGIPFPAA
jgi:catechol 2,3-dioxygenase-like lactoylglutathione lyase family enzyme